MHSRFINIIKIIDIRNLSQISVQFKIVSIYYISFLTKKNKDLKLLSLIIISHSLFDMNY